MVRRKRLGERLLELGAINQEQLDIALKEQKKTGELLGAILFSLGFISQKDLFTVLSFSEDEEDVIKNQQGILPDEINNLVRQSQTIFRSGDKTAVRKDLDSLQSPLVSLVEKVILAGIAKNATDIHIGPDVNGVRIRYRVDGVLQHGLFLPRDLLNPIVSRVKVMGEMNIAETRLPQDGSAEFYGSGKKLDLRISTYPVVGGENVVIRILDKSRLTLGLENLGFFDDDAESIREILQLPYGLILVTGPTGSGKTTTLYSCLSVINTVYKHIFTIEDPVEYFLPLARQSEVNIKAGLTFASGLRSLLRQDPDVILVGEMRDLETAELTIRAALTGHLVFSTLHTNNAISSIARMIDLGIQSFLVKSTLEAVIAQRLVRVFCNNCKEEIPPDDITYARLQINPSESRLYKPRGCSNCGDTGYKGRTVIYEVLRLSPDIKRIINEKADLDAIERQAIKEGFRTMFDLGLEKVKMGITSISEVMAATKRLF